MHDYKQRYADSDIQTYIRNLHQVMRKEICGMTGQYRKFIKNVAQ